MKTAVSNQLITILVGSLALVGCIGGATTQVVGTPTLPFPTSTGTATSEPTLTSPPPAATATNPPTTTPVETLSPTPTHLPSGATTLPPLQAGQAVTVTFIDMIDSSVGWAIGDEADPGDHVLRTQDGGSTWQDVTPPEPAPGADQSQKAALGTFMSAETGWVTYFQSDSLAPQEPPVVWITHDRGSSWEASQPFGQGLLEELYLPSDLKFLDAQNGWLLAHLGAGMNHDYFALFHSTDGGKSWETLIDPFQGELQSCSKTGIVFADAQMGWLTGDCHAVAPGVFLYKTEDGGRTWNTQEIPVPSDAAADLFNLPYIGCGTYDPIFIPPNNIILNLRCDNFESSTTDYYVYRTTDGGENWSVESFPGDSLLFSTSEVGWALGRDIYQSTDGGQTWDKVASVNWNGQFDFVNEQLGWAVARADGQIALVKTEDGGSRWEELKPVISSR
jgi:photosystem II stability/assembly factor-like uncharacterized protein